MRLPRTIGRNGGGGCLLSSQQRSRAGAGFSWSRTCGRLMLRCSSTRVWRPSTSPTRTSLTGSSLISESTSLSPRTRHCGCMCTRRVSHGSAPSSTLRIRRSATICSCISPTTRSTSRLPSLWPTPQRPLMESGPSGRFRRCTRGWQLTGLMLTPWQVRSTTSLSRRLWRSRGRWATPNAPLSRTSATASSCMASTSCLMRGSSRGSLRSTSRRRSPAARRSISRSRASWWQTCSTSSGLSTPKPPNRCVLRRRRVT